MKKGIAVLAALCLFVFSVCPAAALNITMEEAGIGLELPSAFTAVQNTDGDIRANSDFISTLGHSTTSFSVFCDKAGVLIFAATADNQRQVQLSRKTTDFSTEIGELAALAEDAESFNTAMEALVQVGTDETLVGVSQVDTGNGRLFVKIEKLIDATHDYSCMQYITITDGDYYSLIYYNFGGSFTDAQKDEMQDIFSSLTLPGSGYVSDDGRRTDVLIIVVGVLMVIAVLFSLGVAISLVVEIVRRRMSVRAEDEKIKRRRF